VPWGLFIVLAVYALGVVFYVWATYWRTPQYQAAQEYTAALRLLGMDDGRKCTEAQLNEAFGHMLEAARLVPEERGLAKHVERLRWRFDERHFKLRPDLVHKAEAVSAMNARIEKEREAILVVGARDKGWAADQVMEGPQQTVLYAIPGGVLIIALWGYTRFTGRKARAEAHEAERKKIEADVAELGKFRQGLDKMPVDSQVRRTLAEAEAQERKPRTTGKRPPVKRRPPQG